MRAATLFVDAGGVIVDPDWVRVSGILRRGGIDVSPAALEAAEPAAKRAIDVAPSRSGADDRRRVGLFLAAVVGGAGADLPDEAELRAEHARRNLWSVVAPGAADALDRLRAAGVGLVLVSNAAADLPEFLGELGLARRFDHLVVSGIVGIEKPDPGIFREALRVCGADPANVIHVGDLYEIDVVGARSAGIRGVLVDPSGIRTDADCPRFPSLAAVAAAILAAR
jgi:HAD superfamily hydrolase (TIGR01509 family)